MGDGGGADVRPYYMKTAFQPVLSGGRPAPGTGMHARCAAELDILPGEVGPNPPDRCRPQRPCSARAGPEAAEGIPCC